MGSLLCPFCNRSFPLLADLERHANEHLDEEELARDAELAHQIALGSSPIKLVNRDMEARNMAVSGIESSNSIFCGNRIGYGGTDIEEKIDCLVRLQFRSNFHRVEHGLMTLLKRCLGLEKGKVSCVISGQVNHFQSLESEDLGWGCGWRNIQMLSSYLLKERDEAKNILFGGVGFVPDIPSLQRWVEIAWEMGFDTTGSETFNKKIYGKKKWIGTTECAALLRSFGLRARIVDFGSKSLEEAVRDHTNVKRKNGPVYGPMDKFLCPRRPNNLKTNSTYEKHAEPKASSLVNNYNSSCSKSKRMDGHQLIAEWVWNYFSETVSAGTDGAGNVLVSEKTPLYFQHDGHSRTIIGIQVQKGADGMLHDHSLLVLDPGHRTASLERSLEQNSGWQKFIKRGVHTLRKPQYQLCYVDSGIASGAELEHLKTIDSVFFDVEEMGKRETRECSLGK